MGKKDVQSLVDFETAKKQCVGFLIQNDTFWKQWPKQFWLAAGDANTPLFPFHGFLQEEEE